MSRSRSAGINWLAGKSGWPRRASQSKERTPGRAAAAAFTSAIRTDTCWNWRRRGFGRCTDQESGISNQESENATELIRKSEISNQESGIRNRDRTLIPDY